MFSTEIRLRFLLREFTSTSYLPTSFIGTVVFKWYDSVALFLDLESLIVCHKLRKKSYYYFYEAESRAFGNLLNKPPLLVFGIIFRFRDVAFNIPTLISNRREKKTYVFIFLQNSY